jgi:hypothetical protein
MQERWCEAQEQYALSLEIGEAPTVEPTAQYVSEQCSGGGGDGGNTDGLNPPAEGTPLVPADVTPQVPQNTPVQPEEAPVPPQPTAYP